MATDFFDRQDNARRSTVRLTVLFSLAVVAIIASIELLLAVTLGFLGRNPDTGAIDWTVVSDPQLFALATVGTLVVVGGGSLFKVAQLRAGGRVVAEQLGGRLLNSDTAVASEQRLLNIVEEMAIASGTPTPPVYLMDQEEGINAFAAGFQPSDAVIGVTRGTAETLTRDELQGVIAHEFSHILNGDMRLNIRLMGLLHGILIIGILGYFILRMAAFSGHRRRSREGGNQMPLLALGAGLMAVGFFGTFFGNMIKAAVSRQREFLADASAVQFTRQASGIAGALKKIGGIATGSVVQSPNAPESSHLFFGRATSGLSALFSTHPPLPERIRRLDPSWDGIFPAVAAVAPSGTSASAMAAGAVGLAGGGEARGATEETFDVSHAVEDIGAPTDAHIRYAAALVHTLPPAILSAAHEPHGARAVVYTLLLDRDSDIRRAQLDRLAAAADGGVHEETLRLAPLVDALDVRTRLPLIDIALPALRRLTATQYELFRENIVALVQADEAIDVFEWSLSRILLHDLAPAYARVPPPRVRVRNLSAVGPHLRRLLSMLAHAGHRDTQAAGKAFDEAWRTLRLPEAHLLEANQTGVAALDDAVERLAGAAPAIKRQVLRAAITCITADRHVTATEVELVRAVSTSLGCPMPPVLAT
jgi:Zn-dependent protease with chaperone function